MRDAANEHSGDFVRPLFVSGHGLHATGGATSSDLYRGHPTLARGPTIALGVDARTYLASLIGKTIYTLGQRRPNRILAIEGDRIIVATEKSPAGEHVPIAWVQDALDSLFRDRELVISVESVGYRSSFIGAVLGTLPNVEVESGPRRVRLVAERSRMQALWIA